jgi:hypothetical protein
VLTVQQSECVERVLAALETQRGIILAGGMGSGKTVQALNVAYTIAGVGIRALFVVPAGLVQMWLASARRFCATVDIRAIKGSGDADSIATFVAGRVLARRLVRVPRERATTAPSCGTTRGSRSSSSTSRTRSAAPRRCATRSRASAPPTRSCC